MGRIKEFLKINKLRQVDLAEYLGISEPAVSNVVKGKSAFSRENLIKIINNTCGWETQMLVEDETTMPENETSSSELLDYFRSKVAEQEQEIIELHSKIAVLEYQIMMLEREKGKSASDATSTIANAG